MEGTVNTNYAETEQTQILHWWQHVATIGLDKTALLGAVGNLHDNDEGTSATWVESALLATKAN